MPISPHCSIVARTRGIRRVLGLIRKQCELSSALIWIIVCVSSFCVVRWVATEIGTRNTHGGRRFHFLLSVVQKDSLGSQQVLASLISSAFSVYSRKDADKKRKKADAGGAGDDTSNAFQPFAPELFTRTFVKKVSDHNGRTLEETIDNHWTGLMRYFQAPNIRFKSRHPLLLAARFSNVVVILRDCNHFPEMDEAAIRAFLCACNFPPNCRSSDCLSCYQRQIQQMGGLDKGDGGSLALWYISMRRNLSCPLEAKRWVQTQARHSEANPEFTRDVTD